MRLLTRSDFDGLACGALLKAFGVIDSWKFVHPKDVQDGVVDVTDQDVLANVPYVPGCGMWFDHHSSESAKTGRDAVAPGEYRVAPSAARVVYDYYGGEEKYPDFREMVLGVDKVDSGQLAIDEINNPQGWVLLGFLMDPRTGLGRFREFTISNYDLMMKLLDCIATMNINEILALPDVVERIEVYNEQNAAFTRMIKEHTEVYDNVIFTDLRGVNDIYTGNRFLIYGMYPKQNVSVWVVDGRSRVNCPIAVGHSVLNRTCKTDIGALCARYGGGGHKAVGTCQVAYEKAEDAIEDIVNRLIAENV